MRNEELLDVDGSDVCPMGTRRPTIEQMNSISHVSRTSFKHEFASNPYA
jgi:hypothetical protein